MEYPVIPLIADPQFTDMGQPVTSIQSGRPGTTQAEIKKGQTASVISVTDNLIRGKNHDEGNFSVYPKEQQPLHAALSSTHRYVYKGQRFPLRYCQSLLKYRQFICQSPLPSIHDPGQFTMLLEGQKVRIRQLCQYLSARA